MRSSFHHITGKHLATTDRRQHIVNALACEARQSALQLLVRKRLFGALEGARHNLAAEPRILRPHRVTRCAADRGAGFSGDDKRLPGGGRHLPLGHRDLDLIAVLKLRQQRRDAPVDLGAHSIVADIGVDRIGKINGRRAARQRDQPTFRRKAEHLIVEQLELRVLQKFLR